MNKIFKMLIIITSFFTITACKNASNGNRMGGNRPPRFE